MKRLLLIAVCTASVVGAAPLAALAQDAPPQMRESGPPEGPRGEWPLERRIDWLSGRIDRASDRGWLSGNEIGRGREELDAIRHEQERLRDRDGGQLSPEDRTYLHHRIDELNRTLRWTGDNPPPPWAMP